LRDEQGRWLQPARRQGVPVVERRFDGVIFDMDGTLIESRLDFAAIRRRLGVPPAEDILVHIDSLPPAERQAAVDWLLQHELGAVRQAGLLPGARQTVEAIRKAGLKTALLTRNSREAMQIVLGHFAPQSFDLAWSREDGPIKPEPEGILRACRTLGIRPDRTAVVGDFYYDIVAARDAGAYSVLLVGGDRPAFAEQADAVIAELGQLPGLLEV
jgi:HAD superfamily hydrolase (TIGR01509 family)